jgi:uncharacterized phiE125 gp8 family phage protein
MAEPVTVAELRGHLRLVSTNEDAYLGTLIAAAREQVEHLTDRCLIPQTMTLRIDAFPSDRKWIELPAPPAVSVSAVTYLDSDGATQTLASGNYSVIVGSEPALLLLDDDQDWPDAQDTVGAVTITYLAGYASAGVVPARLKMAVLWLAAWWYEQRVPVNVGNIVNAVPDHLTGVLEGMRTFLIHSNEATAVTRATPA